ncbi:MAG: hypothetical protein NTW52_08085 [Planctomycetota bacterium]|nr:hypothetical protein [Planctomycetota bacterium]
MRLPKIRFSKRIRDRNLSRSLLVAGFILVSLVGPSTGHEGMLRRIASQCHAAERIFEATFSRSEDLNRDRWPDQWKRKTGRQHPAFVKMEIVTKATGAEDEIQAIRRSLAQWFVAIQQNRLPGDVFTEAVPDQVDRFLESTVFNPCFQIQMNGGSAQIDGPLVPVIPQQAYRLDARVACELRDPFETSISIVWLDASGEELGMITSDAVNQSCAWRQLHLDKIENIPEGSRFAKIRLNVEPKTTNAIVGTIQFDSIAFSRIPRLDLQMIPESRIVSVGETVSLRCKMDAIDDEASRFTLRVADHNGDVVWESDSPLRPSRLSPTAESDSLLVVGQQSGTLQTGTLQTDNPSKSSRTIEWKVRINQPGFYRFVVNASEGSPVKITKSTTAVAYIKSNQQNVRGISNRKLGWTMPSVGSDVTLNDLPPILGFSSVGRVKLSIWLAAPKTRAEQSIDWLNETLTAKNVDCCGVIAPEPGWLVAEKAAAGLADATNAAASLGKLVKYEASPKLHKSSYATSKLGLGQEGTQSEPLADILDDSRAFDKLFLPLWTKASLFLINYQVGWDNDLSLSENGRRKEILDKLSSQVRKYAPESQLIVPWDVLAVRPAREGKAAYSLNRLMYVSQPPLTATELTRVANDENQKGRSGSWVSMDPIDSRKYSTEDRIRDLLQRMIALHSSPLETGWISNPCDEAIGILDARGRPEELLLPFRTIAQSLDGAEDFYSFPMEQPVVANTLYRAGQLDNMVLWAYQPQWIDAQWGDRWTATDIWGRPVDVRRDAASAINAKQLYVGRWPIFVKDVDRNMIKWQTDVQIKNPIIENRVGQSDPILLSVRNPADKSVDGKLKIVSSSLFQSGVAEKDFSVEATVTKTIEVPILLRRDVSQSNEPIEIIFEQKGTPPVQFSVRKSLSLGLKNFQLETKSRFDDRGRLVIEMIMTNSSGQASSFDCTVHVPDRPRQRVQVINLQERATKSIILSDGAQYRGKSLLIRCEEIGTGRVLNQRVIIPN